MPYLALYASMLAGEMYSLQLYMNSSFSMSPAGGKLSAAAALAAALGTSLAAGAALAALEAAADGELPPPGPQAAIAAAAPVSPAAYRNPRRLTLVSVIRRSVVSRSSDILQPPLPAVTGISRTPRPTGPGSPHRASAPRPDLPVQCPGWFPSPLRSGGGRRARPPDQSAPGTRSDRRDRCLGGYAPVPMSSRRCSARARRPARPPGVPGEWRR